MLVYNFPPIQAIYEIYLQYPSICTDSRYIQQGSLFFALTGPTYNGNHFAKQALEKGAAFAIVDDPDYYQAKGPYILVKDVLQTLQELAKWHRASLMIPVIAITGSNGKTTTKELLATILSKQYTCYATKGNFNNHIGVPLSVLTIQPETEIAVLEMGANHVGEIAMLCEIVQPTHGLITNVGPAHLEGFGNIAGVIKGKSELYDYIQKTGGTIFINSTDTVLAKSVQSYKHCVNFLGEGDFYQASFLQADPYLSYKSETGLVVTTQLLGEQHFNNVAAAACMGKYMGIDLTSIDTAIQNYIPSNNRSQVLTIDTNIVILDAYNANPASMKAALLSFMKLSHTYKVVILGNMNELGTACITFHQEIVALTAKHNYQEVLLCGPDMGLAAMYNVKALHFHDKEKLTTYLQGRVFSNTAILIKGGNSYGLESLVGYIKSA